MSRKPGEKSVITCALPCPAARAPSFQPLPERVPVLLPASDLPPGELFPQLLEPDSPMRF